MAETLLLKLNAISVTGTSGWTSYKLDETGVRASNIINRVTGLGSNIDMEHSGATWILTASTGLVSADFWGVEVGVWRNYNRVANGSVSTTTLIGSGLVAGQQYRITFAGAHNTASDVTITANGVSATYVNPAQSTPISPTEPVSLICTAVDNGDGRAKIDFTFASTSGDIRQTFIVLSDDVATLGTINDNNQVEIGQTCTWSPNFTPTSATINGVALSGISASGFTVPDYADGVSLPDYGLATISATDGSTTTTTEVRVFAKSGWHYTRITDISNDSVGYLKHYYPDLALFDAVTLLNGNEFDPPVVVNTVDYDGRIATDYLGDQEIYIRSNSTGIVTSKTISFSSGTAPVMPADRTVTVYEGAATLGTFPAASGTPPITYEIGGADAALFTINTATAKVDPVGALTTGQSGVVTVTPENSAGTGDPQTINWSVIAVPDVDRGLTAIGLTAVGLTATGLTAVGL